MKTQSPVLGSIVIISFPAPHRACGYSIVSTSTENDARCIITGSLNLTPSKIKKIPESLFQRVGGLGRSPVRVEGSGISVYPARAMW
jgi:hypothetical protein